MNIGDKVRLKRDLWRRIGNRGQRQVAKIMEFYQDIPGGVMLDAKIGGFYSWNVKDLELVRRTYYRLQRQSNE